MKVFACVVYDRIGNFWLGGSKISSADEFSALVGNCLDRMGR